MGELRKDLRTIQNVVNGTYHKHYASIFAGIKKEGRDLHETMSYKGHQFVLTTWQERDNFVIDLTDECCGDATVLHLVDDEAREMIEDGFIDPRNMIQSAVKYADSIGAIQPIRDEDEHQFASSEASRTAAAKHEAMLKKNYGERRKIAEEVPTADNILDEVLTDMGQAPEVSLPGQDNTNTAPERQVTTQAEPKSEPTPEPTTKPEETKAESKPEDNFFEEQQSESHPESVTKEAAEHWNWEEGRTAAALPEKTLTFKKKKKGSTAQKVADVMDLLEGMGHFGIGSRYGAAVAQDMAEAKSGVDYDKAEVSGDARSEETTAPVELEQHVNEKGEPKEAATYTEEGILPSDTSEGGKAHYFGESQELPSRPAYECMDCRHVGPLNRFGTCEKCQSSAVTEKIHLDKTPSSEAKMVGASAKKADDQRKDDVPVTPEGKPSEDKKQPVSDLADGPPEAHDVPPPVDSKVADQSPIDPYEEVMVQHGFEPFPVEDLDPDFEPPYIMQNAVSVWNNDSHDCSAVVLKDGSWTFKQGTGGPDYVENGKNLQDLTEFLDNFFRPDEEENGPTIASDKTAGGEWEVVVGNIGTVYSGPDEQEAQDVYNTYVDQSLSGAGRGVGEDVVLMKDGEIAQEHGQQMEEGDPLENMPGYREHSNALNTEIPEEELSVNPMDAQIDALGMEDQENLGEIEGDILGEF
jgi:hypothetical protein